MEGFKRLKAPKMEYVDRGPRVVDMSAASALAFFGYASSTHEAVDIGPPAPAQRIHH